MEKIAEYEQHAAQCRQMAAKATNPDHKMWLEQMAHAWDELALGREGRQMSACFEISLRGGATGPQARRGDVRACGRSRR